MPNSTRLQHLLNALQEDATLRVQWKKIIDSNYRVSWDRLLSRSDNRFIRLATQIEASIMLPSVGNRNISDLASILDRCEESVQGLRDLDQFDDAHGSFVVHCIVRKLDMPTKEAWSIFRENKVYFDLQRDIFISRTPFAIAHSVSSIDWSKAIAIAS